MKTSRPRLWSYLTALLFLAVASSARALDVGLNEINNTIQLGASDPRVLAARIINIAMLFLGTLAVGVTLFAGFKWMTAQGNEENVASAKNILRSGLIGLGIILASWGIALFVVNQLMGAASNVASGGCNTGDTAVCGCGGARTCIGGAWGGCIGSDCSSGGAGGVSCDANPLTPTCDKDNTVCGLGYYCDDSCKCQTQGGLGSSCDSDPATPACDADNSRCGQYLECKADGCVCFGPPVITAISPAGGFCTNNHDQTCNQDSDCSSGLCNLASPNGAANNLITIQGFNFGTSSASSSIVFAGNKNGIDPVTLNSNCTQTWTDNMIIIAIPAGTVAGPIQVNTIGGSDTTDNDTGPKLPDFVPNNVVRPGICRLDPNHGSMGADISYYGLNLKGDVYFGNADNKFKALSSVFNPNGFFASAKVPNIGSGQTSTFVAESGGGKLNISNYFSFIKDAEADTGPSISSFEPASGAPGQYVTIFGKGFGSAHGHSKVLFGTTEADYNFPEACLHSVWSDNQIIVKVPGGLAADAYKIKLEIGTWHLDSGSNFFTVTSEALRPSLCKVEPVRGTFNSPVTLWGEYFGVANQSGTARFFSNKDNNALIEKDGTADRLQVMVPQQSISGPIKVVKAGIEGNGLNFSIGACASNSDCGLQFCCPEGSPKKGQCTGSLTDCYSNVFNSVFQWNFATGWSNTLNKPCGSVNGGQCTPKDSDCSGGLVCEPTACVCKKPCGTKTSGTCQPNAADCNAGEICDPAACVCNSDTNFSCAFNALKNGFCPLNNFCPNSPGKCSPFNPQGDQYKSTGVGCADSDCGSLFTQCNGKNNCAYSLGLNRCFARNSSSQALSCTLDATFDFGSVIGKVNKFCNSDGHFEIRIPSSCPSGWTNRGSSRCVKEDETCQPCPDKFNCLSSGGQPGCFTADVCPSGSACSATSSDPLFQKCVAAQQPTCDCCCEKGQDTRDCCAGLTCAGSCGSGANLGKCSGCAASGTTVTDHDNACNCASFSGKYCDLNASSAGVCTDCTGLTNSTQCQAHADQCCWDDRNQTCRGGNGKILSNNPADLNNYGHCAFYGCDINNPFLCAASQPVLGTTTTAFNGPLTAPLGIYNSTSTCAASCGADSFCRSFGTDSAGCRGSASCCWDMATSTPNKCTGGDRISGGDCAYYNCDTGQTPLTCASTTPANSGLFKGLNNCISGCAQAAYGLGQDCSIKSTVTIFQGNASTTNNLIKCDTSLCSQNFACLNSDGTPGVNGGSANCGTCCCDPKAGLDPCKTAAAPNMSCKADQGNCSGASRGLCCGCTGDTDCEASSGAAGLVGCGLDTCCHGRPKVVSSQPTPDETDVCRNASISVTFNEKMSVPSLTDNFLLLEEHNYADGTCPEGTFVAIYDHWWQRAYANVVSFFRNTGRGLARLFGYDGTALAGIKDNLYCAVSGSVSASENNGQTTMVFTPARLLKASARYYAVIKGDKNLDSAAGVLDVWNIGLNGEGLISGGTKLEGSDPSLLFNNLNYPNSHIFTFKALSDQGQNKGICMVSRVNVTPASYLFQTNQGSLKENDSDASQATFDTVADNDKVLSAQALSIDAQVLHPTAGYQWDWKWEIGDQSVADFVSNVSHLASSQKLIRTGANVSDKNTYAKASVDMSNYQSGNCTNNCNTYFAGNNLFKTAPIYVFVCQNPWPPIESDGSWYPWHDNCNGVSNCDNYNYDFYYCRDAGGPGTADDLPAILSDSARIFGKSALKICSNDKKVCTSDSDCTNGGFCLWSLLKESYFFREEAPGVGSLNAVSDTGNSGEVKVDWQSQKTIASEVTSYKIYYSQTSGQEISKEVPVSGNCAAQADIYLCSATVNGLVNGKQYTFRVTALNANKVESPVSNSLTATPSDQKIPDAPQNLRVSANTAVNRLTLAWDAGASDIAYYKIYRGVLSGKYGESSIKTDGPVTTLTINISNLTAGSQYFALGAVSSAGQESGKSNEVSLVVPGAPQNVKLDNTLSPATKQIRLLWDSGVSGMSYYKLFHGRASRNYDTAFVQTSGPVSSITINVSALADGMHFYALSGVSGTGQEGAYSNEIQVSCAAGQCVLAQ